MSELRAVVEAARELRARGEAFVSATVVRVRGSAYRRAGARMIATPECWVAGTISGGCLEREVLAKGFWRTRDASSQLVTYNEAEDALDERSGSGCQGVIEMLIERHDPGAVRAGDWFELADVCLREQQPVAAVTVFRSQRPEVPVGTRLTLAGGEHACTLEQPRLVSELLLEAQRVLGTADKPYVVQRGEPGREIEALVERIAPPTHLFVFGAGHDVTPLVTLARQLGWTVSVWDALPRVSTRERLRAADAYLTEPLEQVIARLNRSERAAAVVMGHHLEQDRDALRALLRSNARYIGLLGPRRRSEQMLSECVGSDEALSRVYAPVGLSLGAETPAEIAMAILAEVQSVMSGTAARTLRSEPGAIHASAPVATAVRASAPVAVQ